MRFLPNEFPNLGVQSLDGPHGSKSRNSPGLPVLTVGPAHCSGMATSTLLQFEPLACRVEVPFWFELERRKLHEYKDGVTRERL